MARLSTLVEKEVGGAQSGPSGTFLSAISFSAVSNEHHEADSERRGEGTYICGIDHEALNKLALRQTSIMDDWHMRIPTRQRRRRYNSGPILTGIAADLCGHGDESRLNALRGIWKLTSEVPYLHCNVPFANLAEMKRDGRDDIFTPLRSGVQLQEPVQSDGTHLSVSNDIHERSLPRCLLHLAVEMKYASVDKNEGVRT